MSRRGAIRRGAISPGVVACGAVASSVACLLAAGLLAAAGCATDAEPAAREQASEPPPAARDQASVRPHAPRLRTAACPASTARCRTASGRILYVERVDPDGDGDAHFVLASRESISGPGISVIDVRRSLRPSPLPGRGDRLSAAGPVYRGSYGQRQIEAVELHVARAR